MAVTDDSKTPRCNIRPRTVTFIGRLLRPISDEGIISVTEYNEIVANLRHLSRMGTPLPPMQPRLIDQRKAAEMLGVSHANFKKLEREGAIPFKRKMIGSSVRYRNTDILKFIMADECSETHV